MAGLMLVMRAYLGTDAEVGLHTFHVFAKVL